LYEIGTSRQHFYGRKYGDSNTFTDVTLFPVQRRALTSIAVEPTSQPSAYEYLQQYHVPASSMQKAIEALKMLDLVAYDKEWHLVDPVMAAWIKDTRSTTI